MSLSFYYPLDFYKIYFVSVNLNIRFFQKLFCEAAACRRCSTAA